MKSNVLKKLVVVRFGILERISIHSYFFATRGTVERPFPAKTYHYQKVVEVDFNTLLHV
jgi:hypothetical protein